MSLPASGGDRFSTITPDDHGGLIYIATLMSLTYSLITFVARCFIKWKLFGVDDWAMAAAQVLTVAQFIAIVVALSSGLGKTYNLLTDGQYYSMVKAQYANQILLYASLCLSKCSVILLIRRVFTRDMKSFWVICTVMLGAIVVWGIASIIGICAGCLPTEYGALSTNMKCAGWTLRYKLVVIFDIITETILVLIPIYLVWGIQMSMKLKLRVIIAFAFRLPIITFALLFLYYTLRIPLSQNPGVSASPALIHQQAELGYSLISATIPCLKSFLKSFDTGLGLAVGYTQNAYGSGGYGGSYKMESLSKSVGSVGGDGGLRGEGRLRPEKIKNTTRVYSGRIEGGGMAREGSVASGSGGSQEMIIRRDVQWDVRHDDVRPGTAQ
ncbi:hypothetical protein K432DRAFT_450183 [Lepidopterella palustris CBS 459.81]|uniref:Rhodopsin domain-containing protein n=1 Tax=Lepidopterella palustris CBS 459.81 TaxID=1314670 RepID=A0A8E2ECD2_9PEZI|nr:hypothetical protein K432DRAFT_450183 [Lepidopterella palustris CBS 459.81]